MGRSKDFPTSAGTEVLQESGGSSATMKSNNLGERIAAAKSRVSIHDAWGRLGLPNPPPTGKTTVRSPFREDRNPSFSIYLWKGDWRFKDFAEADARGDAVDFIKMAANCSKAEAIATLLSWAGDHAPIGHRKHTGVIKGLRKAAALVVAPPPPPPPPPPTNPWEDVDGSVKFDPLNHTHRILPGMMGAIAIAASRRLPVSSTSRLAEAGILRNMIGSKQQWILVDGPEMPRSVVTAEIRNHDRGLFWHGAKADSCKGYIKGWPTALSLAMQDPSQTIILVEGGPDLLAAYALIEHLSRHDCVAVSILGRGIKQIIPEAQRVFAGRNVHIIPHRDPDKSGEITDGRDAAVKWTDMLVDDCGVGNVTWASLEGLTLPDGRPVKDLCDAIEDGGLERNRAHWDDLMPDKNEQEAEAPTISNNGL
jgi:hypothetical protein